MSIQVHGTVWVTSRNNTGSEAVIHTKRDCHTLNQANGIRSVDPEVYPHRDVCRHCSGRGGITGPHTPRGGHDDAGDTCGSCGGSLSAEDHTACICERFKEVFGDGS